MCTRDTLRYHGCACQLRNNGVTYCSTALQYPHKPCKSAVERVLEYDARENRICKKCRYVF